MKNRDNHHKMVAVPVFVVLCLVANAFAFDRDGDGPLKIKRIAVFMAGELSGKGVKTVSVKAFTNAGGKETPESKAVRDEFMKHLASTGKKTLIKTSGETDAIIMGTFTPFHEGNKWQLSIKAAWTGTGKAITSYTAVFK